LTQELADQIRALAMSGFGLFLLEWLSTLLMLPWTFRLGIPVARRTTRLSGPIAAAGRSFTTDNVVVRAVPDGYWVFRRVFRLFEASTPFPIRGTLRIAGQELTAVGRQPIGGLVFLGAWCVLAGSLIGPLGFALMYGISWLFERARFDEEYDEICRRLRVGPWERA
jgi:hypothetical protein